MIRCKNYVKIILSDFYVNLVAENKFGKSLIYYVMLKIRFTF